MSLYIQKYIAIFNCKNINVTLKICLTKIFIYLYISKMQSFNHNNVTPTSRDIRQPSQKNALRLNLILILEIKISTIDSVAVWIWLSGFRNEIQHTI